MLIHSIFVCICFTTDAPVITPSYAVLFPDSEVVFSCNTTEGTVQWKINGMLHLGNALPAGANLFNLTTLVVNMSANASTYACAIPMGTGADTSNIATLFRAGQ